MAKYRGASTSGDGTIALILIAFWIVCAVGWVLNIVKFVGHFADPLTALEILRGIGILAAPLGIILGYFFG